MTIRLARRLRAVSQIDCQGDPMTTCVPPRTSPGTRASHSSRYALARRSRTSERAVRRSNATGPAAPQPGKPIERSSTRRAPWARDTAMALERTTGARGDPARATRIKPAPDVNGRQGRRACGRTLRCTGSRSGRSGERPARARALRRACRREFSPWPANLRHVQIPS